MTEQSEPLPGDYIIVPRRLLDERIEQLRAELLTKVERNVKRMLLWGGLAGFWVGFFVCEGLHWYRMP